MSYILACNKHKVIIQLENTGIWGGESCKCSNPKTIQFSSLDDFKRWTNPVKRCLCCGSEILNTKEE